MENEGCPYCGGTLCLLGVLGVLVHTRCENCGLDHAEAIERFEPDALEVYND